MARVNQKPETRNKKGKKAMWNRETARYLLARIDWKEEPIFHAADWEDEIDPPECLKCGLLFEEDQEIYLSTWCEECGPSEIDKIYRASFEHASAQLEIHDLEDYDREFEFKPEDYDLCKEAYSANAWHAHMRHNRSNYEDLLKSLCQCDPMDEIRYEGIRLAFESQLRSKLEAIC